MPARYRRGVTVVRGQRVASAVVPDRPRRLGEQAAHLLAPSTLSFKGCVFERMACVSERRSTSKLSTSLGAAGRLRLAILTAGLVVT